MDNPMTMQKVREMCLPPFIVPGRECDFGGKDSCCGAIRCNFKPAFYIAAVKLVNRSFMIESSQFIVD